MFFDRNDRQLRIENDLVAALHEIMPESVVTHVRGPGDNRDHIELRERGNLVGVVWTNASFQRVQILKPTFDEHESKPTPLGQSYLRAVGKVVAAHAADFSYLFLHGVTEMAESRGMAKGEVQALSEARAKAAYGVLDTPGTEVVLGVPRRFVIPYGTGDSLYLSPGASAGRVDFLMFYSDVKDQASGHRGRA
jgi:hypothetical protein